jgi:hypothetical protein
MLRLEVMSEEGLTIDCQGLPTTNRMKNISIDFSCSSSAEAGAGSVVAIVLILTVVTTGGLVVPLLKKIKNFKSVICHKAAIFII